MKLSDELMNFKYHPRIMEIRLILIKQQIARQYGEEVAMTFLRALADMFECNWTMLVGIFTKDQRILNHQSVSSSRKKQEIIFMGNLYGETRYYISERYLNMSTNYLYQSKEKHNPEMFADDKWLSGLNEEVLICGVRSYALEARRFLVSFENFMGVFNQRSE